MLTELLFEKPDTHQPDTFITYEEFLDMPDNEGFAEWADGKVICMTPPGLMHQNIAGFLFRIISWFAEDRRLGKAIIAPFQMRLRQTERGREPDILFVASSHLNRLTPKYLDGGADLAVEIISPESRLRDKNEKFIEYEREGIRECWIIDSEKQEMDFFVLNSHKQYEPQYPDATGIYQSTVLAGFCLDINWLWQESLPTMRDVLGAWEKRK